MIPAVSGLRGLWRRSMIAWPDCSRDTTTGVCWLQGLRACLDLRQSAAPAHLARVRALDELSIGQCTWLAQQQGFAGQLTFNASHFEWTRSIDFQPRALSADAGSLCWEGDVLVETGRDIAYIEHWHRDDRAPTLPVAAVSLRDADENTAAAMLRVGAQFMFARDRPMLAAAGRTLGQCIAGAATLQQAQGLVDCEISFGTALPGGFQITASTLPWRIGDILDPRFTRGRLGTMDRTPNGAARRRRWEIADSEGEPAALAAAGDAAAGLAVASTAAEKAN
jgi:hypothetical protein